jgi:hypothetical protein
VCLDVWSLRFGGDAELVDYENQTVASTGKPSVPLPRTFSDDLYPLRTRAMVYPPPRNAFQFQSCINTLSWAYCLYDIPTLLYFSPPSHLYMYLA